MIEDGLATPGQHVVVYGERGVGKTSLANVVGGSFASHYANCEKYLLPCDEDDDFESLVAKLYEDFAVEFLENENSVEHDKTTSAAGSVPGVAKGGLTSARKDLRKFERPATIGVIHPNHCPRDQDRYTINNDSL